MSLFLKCEKELCRSGKCSLASLECSSDFPEAFFEFVSCVTIGSLPLGEVQGVLRDFPNASLENR